MVVNGFLKFRLQDYKGYKESMRVLSFFYTSNSQIFYGANARIIAIKH